MIETDSEFVELLGTVPCGYWGQADCARVLNIARRGAAMQWRLTAENERLREALRPFADALQGNWSQQPDDMPIEAGPSEHDLRMQLRLGDFRKARAALGTKE